MKKKWLSGLLIGSLCLALGLPGTAYADGQKVVTLGADLTEDQKTAVLKYFGVLGQNIQTLTITNQDERNHLGSYVPLEQIGTRTFSCALVCPTNYGGIQVKTANLSWVTSNMIASTLSTSGVVNCDVLAASPFEVSGTGALTGIIMAYETASGTTLDPVKKELATQELIATGTIANEIGQQQATSIVNEIKIQVIEGAVVEEEEVEEIIDYVMEDNPEVTLSDEDRALLTGLMTQIAEQQYNYEEMKDTLQRVEDNVNGLSDKVNDAKAPDINIEINNNVSNNTDVDNTNNNQQELDADSILMNTDDSALGENVNIDSTNEEALPENVQENTQENDQAQIPDGFEITTSDSYSDGNADNNPAPDYTFPENDNTDSGITLPEDNDETTLFPENDYNEGSDITLPENDYSEGSDITLPENDYSEGYDITLPEENDGTGEDLSGTDGEFTDEGTVEVPALVLDDVRKAPENSVSAGVSQISLFFEYDDIVPVSGTLTITDDWGNETARVDLSDKEQVTASAASEEDKADFFWSSGTELLINTNTALEPYQNYTIKVSGTVAQTSDPSITENVPTGTVDETWTVSVDGYGVNVTIAHVNDVRTGAVLSGNVILNDAAFAEISSYDADKISFDADQFDPDYTGFNVTCLQSGKAEFTVDYYDAEGNYLGSSDYVLTIL